MSEALLNGKELARALGRSPCYVTAMRRAGYEFKHRALGRTTLSHALEALDSAPEFVAWYYLTKGWESMPRCLEAKPHPQAEVAGKSY